MKLYLIQYNRIFNGKLLGQGSTYIVAIDLPMAIRKLSIYMRETSKDPDYKEEYILQTQLISTTVVS